MTCAHWTFIQSFGLANLAKLRELGRQMPPQADVAEVFARAAWPISLTTAVYVAASLRQHPVLIG